MPNHRKATELQIQHFNMGSHRIAYTDEGEGSTTVVALHGAPGSVRDLRHIAARLTPSLRVVRLDFAGFGDSLVWGGLVRTVRPS